MYHDIPAELRQLIQPVVEDHSLELVDATLGGSRLRIVVDTPQGDGRVLLDDCAELSREISAGLDAADLVPGPYTLEVSSPGVDRVLGRPVDFERVVGRVIALQTREPLEGRRRFRGRLSAFDAGCARVETDAGAVEVPFEAIAKATAFHPGDVATGGRR